MDNTTHLREDSKQYMQRIQCLVSSIQKLEANVIWGLMAPSDGPRDLGLIYMVDIFQ